MRPFAAVFVFALVTTALADDKPARWEYAELSHRPAPGRPTGKDTNEPPVVTIRWTTGTEDVTVKGWDELAEKLKAPVKKDTNSNLVKVQALNALGAAGWEVVSQDATGSNAGFGRAGTTWLFKRRLP